MKPLLDVDRSRWLSRYDRPPGARGRFPRLAIDFQPRRFDGSFGGNDSPWRRPNFSRLAREVLRADCSRSFRLESAVLGFVTIVSAWPVVVMIHEVIRLLK
jgi:hypothetical protein